MRSTANEFKEAAARGSLAASPRRLRILVVEDEAPVMQGLCDLLLAKGYDVVTAQTGPEGLIKAGAAAPDLILLDVMLPGMDGFEVLRGVRSRGLQTPVVMLTARGTEIDRVLGFQLGVDDYVVKPFSILELLGRLEAVLRRCKPASPPPLPALRLGPVEVDFQRQELRRDGAPVDLPHRAFELLRALAAAGGQVVERDRLIDEVWGSGQEVHPRTLDNLVVKLRQAIEPDLSAPFWLITVPRRGYRLRILD